METLTEKENLEREKAHRRVPQWFEKPTQKNSKILLAFLNNHKDGKLSITKLEEYSKIKKFKDNYSQMKNIGVKNSAKIFEEKDGIVSLWEPVKDFIENKYAELIKDIKPLYRKLINSDFAEDWHEDYAKIIDQVKEIRKRIEAGEKLSAEKDREFLTNLIWENNNGIAKKGRTSLSIDIFENLKQNIDFLTTLEKFIISPQHTEWEVLTSQWHKHAKQNNPVITNRIAAACTLSVTSTTQTKHFDIVFTYLATNNIIPEYSGNPDWFSKNEFLTQWLRQEFKEELEQNETDEIYLNQFIWLLHKHLTQPESTSMKEDNLCIHKQTIKYGAPGTGKTFLAKQEAENYITAWKENFTPYSDCFTCDSQIELIQFHPSYSYEDFIEGLRPTIVKGEMHLTLQNGIFKEFCKRAGQWEIDLYHIDKEKDIKKLTLKDTKELQSKLTGEHWQGIFDLPIADETPLLNIIPPFFFIIDEINRAEIARVFGELMYCLEYRGIQNKIKTQYANLNIETTSMLGKGYFFIPSNLYLIGTMNTIDRSVESFDFALRRRFHWQEFLPNIEVLKENLQKNSQEN